MLSEISSWIMSIAGIICLSVVIELLLPNGQMNKYIKSIFSFFIVLVIVLPLPKLLKKEFDYSNLFNYENSIKIDENYIYQLNLDRINKLKNDIEQETQKYGYKNVEIYINCSIYDNAMQIKSVYVDLKNLVITSNAEHNDIAKIRKHISSIIQGYINIDSEVIYYNE